jgi:hypothetical protein
VNFPDRPVPSVPLTKNAQGLWSVTLGPFEPNLYEYQYVIDGVTVADPGNGHPKPQREVNTSLLLVPGNPPDFLDLREDVPHGTVHEEFYRSRVLNEVRPLLVYTPPSLRSPFSRMVEGGSSSMLSTTLEAGMMAARPCKWDLFIIDFNTV